MAQAGGRHARNRSWDDAEVGERAILLQARVLFAKTCDLSSGCCGQVLLQDGSWRSDLGLGSSIRLGRLGLLRLDLLGRGGLRLGLLLDGRLSLGGAVAATGW